MRFVVKPLETALDMALSAPTCRERAIAHNVAFEERASPGRREIVEQLAIEKGTAHDLFETLNVHYNEKIKVDTDLPPTFCEENRPASYPRIDENQEIVRFENISWAIANLYGNQELPIPEVETHRVDLEVALFALVAGTATPGQKGLVESFLDAWNAERDCRPTFSVFKGDVTHILSRPDWAVEMRNACGLAHINPLPDRRFLVALMQYRVSDVIAAATSNSKPVAHPFCAPTVFDTGSWPYFFPAPADLVGGRAMNLVPTITYDNILAELLHFRIQYQAVHFEYLSWLDVPIPLHPLKMLRNAHLDALRVLLGREDYGQVILDDVKEN